MNTAADARLRLGLDRVTAEVVAPTGVAATDTANIAVAIAALPSTGGVIQFQAGTYILTAPATASLGCINISVDNTTVAGMGIGVTILKLADGTSRNTTGIVRTQSGVSNSRVVFRDFTIDGNKANVSGTPDIVGAYCGVSPNGTATDYDIRFSNVEIKNCTGYGFDPHERTTRLLIADCISHDNGTDGFTLDGCYDSEIRDSVAYSNTRHGFNFVTASTRVRVIGCHAYSNGSNGYTAQNGAKYIQFSSSHAYNNTSAGWALNGTAQTGQQDNTPGGTHTLDGCTVSTNGTHGFQLVGCSNNRLSACHSQDASQTTTNTSDHYRLGESGTDYSTNNTLTGCTWGQTSGVSNAAKWGVNEQTANDGGTYVTGCSGSGTVSGSINLLNATSLLSAAHNGGSSSHPLGVYSFDLPSLHGYKEWNWPPDIAGASAGVITVAGTIYGMRVDAQSGGLISNIIVSISNAGATMTSSQCFASVIDGTTGTELARTADLATVLQGSGITALPLVSSFTPTIGQKLAVLLLGNSSGTMPSLTRSSATSATVPNAGLTSASPRRYFTAGTAQTSMPSSFTMSSTTATGALTFWVALS